MIFDNEKKMQQWLSSQFADGHALKDLINNLESFEVENIPSGISMATKRVYESFSYCLESFEVNEVISENKDISLNPDDIIKPDFLIYAPETESVVIIEIKNIGGPSRQAGTELGAYSAEVKTYIPFLSEGDVVNVIISTVWPTLLRHYIFNEIFWLQKNLICLQPVQTTDGVVLEIIDPQLVVEDDLKPSIGLQHLAGYQLCLYDMELYKGGSYDRQDVFREQMLTAIQAMSVKGYAQKTHGFVLLFLNKKLLSSFLK